MIILFIFLGLLPSFAWLFFFLKEDIHPEPKKMIAKVFFAGAFVTLIVITLQILVSKILNPWGITNHDLVAFALFGLIEETFKFFAAYLIIRKSRFFDEPVDAMIYMVVAALGFAAVENVAIMMQLSLISDVVGIITLRFVGATLLHALSSGLVGYYWAKGIISSRRSGNGKTIRNFIIKGLILATLLHAAFNYLILISRELFYPTILLMVVGLLIFWDFEKIKGSTQKLEI